MKPIGKEFGFWLLIGLTVGATYYGRSTDAAIFFVGAVLFNAIKAK